MKYLTYLNESNKTSCMESLSIFNEIPAAVEDTIYYMRASEQIRNLEEIASFIISKEDISFWRSMILDRVKCAKDWMIQSDDYELHESDFSVFTELLSDFDLRLIPIHRKSDYLISVSVYKLHSLMGALEIHSHVSMYDQKRKEHQTACKYIQRLKEVSKPFALTLNRIDEVLYGRRQMKS